MVKVLSPWVSARVSVCVRACACVRKVSDSTGSAIRYSLSMSTCFGWLSLRGLSWQLQFYLKVVNK